MTLVLTFILVYTVIDLSNSLIENSDLIEL